MFLPFVASRLEEGARYLVDGTNMRFKLVKIVPASEAIYQVQSDCKMVRP